MFVQAIASGPHKPVTVMLDQAASLARAQAALAAPATHAAPQPAQVEAAVKSVNRHLQLASRGVEFSIDEGSGRAIVRLVDSETKQVLRQYPSEEMLSIARSLERLEGLLLHQSA